MIRIARHSGYITLRYLRAFVRQPAWVAITLIQPMIWLLLFGALFKRVVEIPGYVGGSYIEYLTPGVIVMTAISSAGWNGMAFIDDIHQGVMDRFLVSPVWRSALNVGSLVYSALTITIQSLVIVGVSLAVGARFPNGVAGVAVMIVLACLLGAVHRGALECARARRPSARDADRGRHLDHPAPHVPLLGVHAGEPRPVLDSRRLAVQPGQLGSRGRPQRRARAVELVACRRAGRAARVPAPDRLLPRLARVPLLPALALRTRKDSETASQCGGAILRARLDNTEGGARCED